RSAHPAISASIGTATPRSVPGTAPTRRPRRSSGATAAGRSARTGCESWSAGAGSASDRRIGRATYVPALTVVYPVEPSLSQTQKRPDVASAASGLFGAAGSDDGGLSPRESSAGHQLPAGVKSVLPPNSDRGFGAAKGSPQAFSTELWTKKMFEREFGETLPFEACMQLESNMIAPPAAPSSTSIPYSSAKSLSV